MIDYSLLLRSNLELVEKVISYFLSEEINPSDHKEIKEIALQTYTRQGNTSVATFVRAGYLSTYDFILYLGHRKALGENGVKTLIVDITLKLLGDKLLVVPLESIVASAQPRYKANGVVAKLAHGLGLVHNLIFGFGFIAERYRNSVLKIEHVDHGDNHSIGTGFIVSIKEKGHFIVTNKHVIEGHKKLFVKDVHDVVQGIESFRLHPTKDLALVKLANKMDSTDFKLNMGVEIMSEIITMGYPSIPMTKFAYQVVHRGEINSLVEDYEGNKSFLFSAKTSSGNSGSPIIDKSGMVVGIVTEELFEEAAFYKKGKLPYYAAIPSIEIGDFIKNV